MAALPGRVEGRPGSHADPAADQRIRAAARAGAAARRRTAARRWPTRQLLGHRVSHRPAVLPADLRARLCTGGQQQPGRQPVAGIRPRHLRVLHLGAVEHRRIQAPPAARASIQLGHRAAARARVRARPGRVDCRRREPGAVQALGYQAAGLEAGRIPHTAGGAAAVLSPHRQPTTAPQHLGTAADQRRVAGRRPACQGVRPTARTRAARAGGARVGTHRAGNAALRRTRRPSN